MRFFLIGLFLLFSPILAYADCTQTIGANTENINSVGYSTQKYGGEPFIASCTGDVSSVTMGLTHQRTGADWHVEFYSNLASHANVLLGSSDTHSLFGTACPNETTFTFSTPVSLTSGTTYWVVVTNGTTDGSKYADACGDEGANVWDYDDTVTNLGDFASTRQYANFVITGGTPPPPPPTPPSVFSATSTQVQSGDIEYELAWIIFFLATIFIGFLVNMITGIFYKYGRN